MYLKLIERCWMPLKSTTPWLPMSRFGKMLSENRIKQLFETQVGDYQHHKSVSPWPARFLSLGAESEHLWLGRSMSDSDTSLSTRLRKAFPLPLESLLRTVDGHGVIIHVVDPMHQPSWLRRNSEHRGSLVRESRTFQNEVLAQRKLPEKCMSQLKWKAWPFVEVYVSSVCVCLK